MRNFKEVVENKLKNSTETVAFLETEKADLNAKLARNKNEISLLKS